MRSHSGGQSALGSDQAEGGAAASPQSTIDIATITRHSLTERHNIGMQLTHFGHSCLLADISDTTVLFDPGTFSHGFEGITGLSAILITHQHPDHADVARLPALIEANPQAALYADPQTAAQLGEPWQAVHPGDAFRVGSLNVRGTGGRHAVIHPEIPVIDNISYLLGDDEHPARLMHPGGRAVRPRRTGRCAGHPGGRPVDENLGGR